MSVRPMHVVQKPIHPPFCCISCGTVEISGRYFIDLGIEIAHQFDALPEGVVYLCEVCARTFIRELMAVIEVKEAGLGGVSFDGIRTDPVFNLNREVLNRIEQRTDEDSSDSESEPALLSAKFGG